MSKSILTMIAALVLALVASVSISELTFKPNDEAIILKLQVRGGTNLANVAYTFDKCLAIVDTFPVSVTALVCDRESTHIQFSRDVLITRVDAVISTDTAVDPELATTEGCSFRLVTGHTSTTVTPIANGEFHVPPVDSADSNIGDVFPKTVGTVLAAGELFGIQVKNGDFCFDGAACLCDAAYGTFVLDVWGRYL